MSAFGLPIAPEQICIIPEDWNKDQALNALVDAVALCDAVVDRERLRAAVHEREAIMSTGIGQGIAIPHVRIPEVRSAATAVGIAPAGLEYETLDNRPVYVLVLFATPEGTDRQYLMLLAQAMSALKNQDFYRRLVSSRTPEEASAALNE